MEIKRIRRPWEKKSGERHNPDPFYQSSAWRKTRNAFISVNPRCVKCGDKAVVADHIVRIKDGGSPLDWSNLQPMCTPCHNKKDNNAGKRK